MVYSREKEERAQGGKMKITGWRDSPFSLDDIDHFLKVGRVLLALVGVIILLVSLYDITIGIPQDQALLNQGAVMCNGISMSVHDKCPVTECRTEVLPSGTTLGSCQTTEERTRDQQKKVTQQDIINRQRNEPTLAIPIGITFFLLGIALVWWEFREQKQSHLRGNTSRHKLRQGTPHKRV
jgi:hypothetical protein